MEKHCNSSGSNELSIEEMRRILDEYLDKTSPEELRAELDKRKHLQDLGDGGIVFPS